MKIPQSHLNPIKVFSYLFIIIGLALTFGITLGLYTERFTLSPLQTLKTLSTAAATSAVTVADAPPTQVAEPELHPMVLAQIRADKETQQILKKAATVAAKMKKLPDKKKIAFMFLVKGWLPFAPLWEEFFKGHQGLYSIYVHADPSFNSSSELDTGVFRGRRIPNQQAHWGKFSLVEAELRLLATALLDPSNQRFVLLSESCIPLFNFSTVYSYLLNSTQTFVEVYDLEGPAGRDRYKSRLWPAITIEQWRKGSQWFEMNRDLATRIVSDHAYFTVFKKSCWWYSCYADEHYLPSWVNINYGAKNSNRSVMYVDWTRGGSHPVRYGRNLITVGFLEFLRHGKTCEYNGKSTNVCFLFARKFSFDTLDSLLWLAPIVMQF